MDKIFVIPTKHGEQNRKPNQFVGAKVITKQIGDVISTCERKSILHALL